MALSSPYSRRVIVLIFPWRRRLADRPAIPAAIPSILLLPCDPMSRSGHRIARQNQASPGFKITNRDLERSAPGTTVLSAARRRPPPEAAARTVALPAAVFLLRPFRRC